MVCDWSLIESNSRKLPIPLIADSWAVMNYQFLYLLCKGNLNREKKYFSDAIQGKNGLRFTDIFQ